MEVSARAEPEQNSSSQNTFKSVRFYNAIPPGARLATSGTTIRVPVKSHLSPAWTISTVSALKITSKLGNRIVTVVINKQL